MSSAQIPGAWFSEQCAKFFPKNDERLAGAATGYNVRV
jgi:hypothetical protein